MTLTLVKSADFGNVTVDFYSDEMEIWMTRQQVGTALGYSDPIHAISKLHARYKERLDKFSVVTKLTTTDGKRYDTHTYSAKGVYEICRWSRQPKANAFFDWVYDVLEGLRTNRLALVERTAISPISPPPTKLDQIVPLFDVLKRYSDVLLPEINRAIQEYIVEALTGKPSTKQPDRELFSVLNRFSDFLGVPRPQKDIGEWWGEIIRTSSPDTLDILDKTFPVSSSSVIQRMRQALDCEIQARHVSTKWYPTSEIALMAGVSTAKVALAAKQHNIRQEPYIRFAPVQTKYKKSGSVLSRVVYNEEGKNKLLELVGSSSNGKLVLSK